MHFPALPRMAPPEGQGHPTHPPAPTLPLQSELDVLGCPALLSGHSVPGTALHNAQGELSVRL